MWVLDGNADALFAYDLESGDALAEYELDSSNGDPHGLWSDGVTAWVSDHIAKRLFAYRLPVLDEEAATEGEDDEDAALERVRDEEFTLLSRASNNSPRGIWSVGDVMYVADASDGKVYTCNMPDAIDSRLASLSLSEMDFGEFSGSQNEYEGVATEGATETTIEAEAAQRQATVAIEPADSEACAQSRSVTALYVPHEGDYVPYILGAPEFVNSPFRELYPAGLPALTPLIARSEGPPSADPAAASEVTEPWPDCLRGEIADGFSLALYEGGSVDELDACAQSSGVSAVYALAEGEYAPYILGAPEFVNAPFRALFPDGLPPETPLLVKREPPLQEAAGADSSGN